MNSELAKIRERIAQQQRARNQQIADALDAARQAARTAVAGPLDGDRVFDTVTGQEGVIVGRARENIVVQPRHG